MTQRDSLPDQSVRLPNGSTLTRGGRVRVPKDMIWHPDVVANAERLGWELENTYSSGSEVLFWPASDEEGQSNG